MKIQTCLRIDPTLLKIAKIEGVNLSETLEKALLNRSNLPIDFLEREIMKKEYELAKLDMERRELTREIEELKNKKTLFIKPPSYSVVKVGTKWVRKDVNAADQPGSL